MSHAIGEFTRPVAPHSGFPYGDTKDDPTGTLVNRLAMTDMWQTFQRLMFNAGVTPNGLDDSTLNGFQIVQAIYKFIAAAGNGMAAAMVNADAGLNHTPILCSGMNITLASGTYTVHEGWVMYNGQLVYSPQFTYPASPLPAGTLYFTIGNIDGLPAITAHAWSMSPPTDNTHFPITSLTDVEAALGITALQAQMAALQPSAWATLTPATGWATTALVAGYSKDGLGYVSARGVITNASTAAPALDLFTFPAGNRPSTTRRFAMTIYNANANQFEPGYIEVSTAGVATLIPQVGSAITVTNWYVYLDSINFNVL